MTDYSTSFSTILLLISVCLFACSTTENPESPLVSQITVEGATFVSNGFPEGTITMDTTLTYVGGETFILYGVARCEIHLYVEADESGRVLRLYWFQFEGYLPSFIPRSYDYLDDPYRTMIGQHQFFDSVSYYNVTASREDWSDDSDIEHVLRLLEQKGYHLDDDIMRIRLVRLDESKKQELMLIYLEDLAQHGLSIANFEAPGGDLKWAEAHEGLRKRTLAGMKIDMK